MDWSMDIYALGITMAVLFTASEPYPALADKALPAAVLKQRIRPALPAHTPPAYA